MFSEMLFLFSWKDPYNNVFIHFNSSIEGQLYTEQHLRTASIYTSLLGILGNNFHYMLTEVATNWDRAVFGKSSSAAYTYMRKSACTQQPRKYSLGS